MKKDSFLVKTADIFDLPADITGGLLHIETEGNREVFFENHKGIISLSEEEIEINSSGGSVFVTGSLLRVTALSASEVRIGGVIEKIEFSGRRDA